MRTEVSSPRRPSWASEPPAGGLILRLRQCLPLRLRQAIERRVSEPVVRSVAFLHQPARSLSARISFESALPESESVTRHVRSELLPLPITRQATSDPLPRYFEKARDTSFALSRLRTTEEPYALTFDNCCYYTSSGDVILQDVSGSVGAGHVLAVMGPSGAGKTTLLSMLTLERQGGWGTGRITLSGQPLTYSMYTRHCAMVTQHDKHWPYLTARDHLRFAIDCYRPELSRGEKRSAIDGLLEATGLVACQHTNAGSATVSGMSGGQRRRLSLALALAKQPAMIFLDEPTSGLDSAAAAKIMYFLKVTAQQAHVPILCTVHQPSATVFSGFDDVLIMSLGRVAYFGPAVQMAGYLASIGKPLPTTGNPAEYMLDCINPDFSDQASVMVMLDEWRQRAPALQRPLPKLMAPPARRAGPREQLVILSRRHAKLIAREPVVYLARATLMFFTNTFIALVYFNTRELVQEQVMYRFYFFGFALVVPLVFHCVVVTATHHELNSIRREVKEGMYSPLPYILATSCLQTASALPLGLAALLPAYALTNLGWASLPATALVVGAMLLAFECLAQLCAHVPVALLGLILYLVLFLITFLFSGLFVRQSAVHWPIRGMLVFNPLRNGYTAFTKLAFEASPPYTGVKPCPPCPIWDRVVGLCGKLPSDDQLQCDVNSDEFPRGFYCPGEPIMNCFGITGEQILRSLNFMYDAADADFNVLMGVAHILLAAMVFKTAFGAILHARCASGEPPKRPPSRRDAARYGQALALRSAQRKTVGRRTLARLASGSRRTGSVACTVEAECRARGADRFFRLIGERHVGSQGQVDSSWVMDDSGTEASSLSDDAEWVVDRSDSSARGSSVASRRPDPPPHRPSLDRLRAFRTKFELRFVDVSYELAVGRSGRAIPEWRASLLLCCGLGHWRRKLLLRDVCASVGAGHVLAVLGPSGAGKTTLLSLLTLDRGVSGVPRGTLTLNGTPLTPELFGRYCAVVTQHDEHWPFLTARDHLSYAVAMYRPDLSWRERERKTVHLLEATGLSACQHTRAGSSSVLGLSSGQRRRLSLALALAKQPAMIFLDEPTSGLDSAAAAKIMEFLKVTAATMNVAILCTVHQPSAAVYQGFDDVLVLASGRVAYFGAAAELGNYLEAIDRPLPPNANPAEYILDLVNQDFTDVESVRSILAEWNHRAERPPQRPPVRMAPSARRASFFEQVLTLLHRHSRLTLRSPLLYVSRAALNACVMVFFGYIYIDTRKLEQTQILNKSFFYFWMVAIPSSYSILAVYALGIDLRMVLREVRNGMYSPMAYVVATSLLQLPMVVLVCLSGLLPSYAIIGPWASFTPVLLACSVNLWAFECIAQFFSLVASPTLGMLQCLAIWICSLLFCGLTIQGEDIVWPIRGFYYVLPLKWALSTAVYQVASACPDYEGTVECDGAHDPLCPSRGFLCEGTEEDPLGIVCFGRNSSQIMTSLHHTFPAFSVHDNLQRDVFALLLIGGTFKFAHVLFLHYRCRVGRQIEPPGCIEAL